MPVAPGSSVHYSIDTRSSGHVRWAFGSQAKGYIRSALYGPLKEPSQTLCCSSVVHAAALDELHRLHVVSMRIHQMGQVAELSAIIYIAIELIHTSYKARISVAHKTSGLNRCFGLSNAFCKLFNAFK